MHKQLLSLLFAAASALPLMAGGFWLQLGTPSASNDPLAAGSVMTVVATGCVDPAKAELRAMAIREENGKRTSSPLKLVKMNKPGTFALPVQWPAGTRQTIQLIGEDSGMTTSVLVNVDGDKFDRASAKFFRGEPKAEDVNALIAAR